MGQPVAFFEVISPDAIFTDPDGNQVGLWS